MNTRYDRDYDRGYDDDRDYDNPRTTYGRSDYGDRGYGDRGYGRDFGRSYSRTGGYERDYSRTGGRDSDRGGRRSYEDPYDREERGFFGRAADEVRSWFGDEEAARRRMDDRSSRSEYYGSDYGRGAYNQDYGRNYGRGSDFDRTGGYDWRRSYGQGGYGQGGSDLGTTYTYTEYWLIPGPMSGRGPQGYEQTGQNLEQQVCERLTSHGQLDASNLRVSADGDEVTLEGTVNSRRDKREAENVAESVRGVRDVHNRLRVRGEPNEGSTSEGAAGSTRGGQNGGSTSGTTSGPSRSKATTETGEAAANR